MCLIKPQFEAGREKVGKKGVVRDKAVHEEVVQMICDFAVENGYSVQGLTFSPVKGPEGNIEYLVFLQKSDAPVNTAGSTPHEIVEASHAAAGQKGLRLMKIAVIPNLDKRDADTYTREILAVLQENGAETLMHEKAPRAV